MSNNIENREFFDLRDKADAAIEKLQSWAEENFTGKSVKWNHAGYSQEGIVLAIITEAVVVKNLKSKREVRVNFSKILEINY